MGNLADKIARDRDLTLMVELDFNGYLVLLATKTVHAAGRINSAAALYDGVIISDLEFGNRFDVRTMTYSSPTLSVEILNTMRLQDLGVLLESGVGTVYLHTPSVTSWTQTSDKGLLFKGHFEIESYDDKRLRFTLTDFTARRWKVIPEQIITTEEWGSYVRTTGGGGSVIGTPQALIFGKWTKGLPLRCVNTDSHVYQLQYGKSRANSTDYTSGLFAVYDKDGATVDRLEYSYYNGYYNDRNRLVTYFDFSTDMAAKEPLSCGAYGFGDGSGEITGTQDGLIQHPAEIIEYLLRYHSLFALAEIDQTSLGTLKNLLPGLKFAALINKQANGQDVVDRILGQCYVGRLQRRGKVGLMTLSTDVSPIVSLHWDKHVVGPVTLTKTPRDDVVNKVKVRYGLNAATGRYEEELTRDYTNHETAKKSHFDYGEQPETVIDLTDVQDEDTAAAIAHRLLTLKAYRHDMASFEVPIWEGLDVEEGDAGLLTIREGPSSDGEGWDEEKCILVERIFKRNTIAQTWWRVAV